MKGVLYDVSGKKKGEVEMPTIFDGRIREDLVMKLLEVMRVGQPYGLYSEAGRRHSASGTISHKRHDWKGHYGHGMSRVPRKIMWRRGTNFYWVGAETSGSRGGRRPHGPKGVHTEKKINSKEMKLAMASGFAATANSELIKKRYSSAGEFSLKLPLVIESKFDKARAKDIFTALKNIFGNLFDLVLKNKEVRAGKGKLRNRKYKSNAGLLLVTGNSEKVKISGIDVVPIKEIAISDLWPLGRLTIYTQKAIEEFGGKK